MITNIEYEDFFDIEISGDEKSDEVLMTSGELDDDGGTGILDKNRQWPKTGAKVQIPYSFYREADYTESQLANIMAAMASIESKTCIEFIRKRPRHLNHISFKSDTSK